VEEAEAGSVHAAYCTFYAGIWRKGAEGDLPVPGG